MNNTPRSVQTYSSNCNEPPLNNNLHRMREATTTRHCNTETDTHARKHARTHAVTHPCKPPRISRRRAESISSPTRRMVASQASHQDLDPSSTSSAYQSGVCHARAVSDVRMHKHACMHGHNVHDKLVSNTYYITSHPITHTSQHRIRPPQEVVQNRQCKAADRVTSKRDPRA